MDKLGHLDNNTLDLETTPGEYAIQGLVIFYNTSLRVFKKLKKYFKIMQDNAFHNVVMVHQFRNCGTFSSYTYIVYMSQNGLYVIYIPYFSKYSCEFYFRLISRLV